MSESVRGGPEKPALFSYKRWVILRILLWFTDEEVITDEEAWWIKRGWVPARWKVDE